MTPIAALRILCLLCCVVAPPVFAAQAGCSHSAPHRQFDFWLGRWVVHTADGRLAGHNEIRAVAGDCMLEEHWQGAGGSSGRSINVYDPVEAQWEQIWYGADGTFIRIGGGLDAEGSMTLDGTIHDADSGAAPFRGRWTLLDDGRVRQFFERYEVTSEAWQPWFEGFYSRVEDAP